MQASKNEIGQSCDMITKFHCPSREMASILSERNNKIVRGVGDSSYYIITKKNFN